MPVVSLPLRCVSAATLLAAFVLSGCAGTRGLRPALTPDDADALAVSHSFEGDTLSAAAWPTQDWWHAWGDPQLDALIAEALAGTPGLDAADARVRKAEAQAGLADDARQPHLGANLQYSGAYLPETLLPAPYGGDYKGVELATLNFRYAPDLWGGKRAHWQAAVGSLRAAEVDAQQARLLLAGNIARTYLDLDQAHEAHQVATAETARAQRLLALATQRVRAGIDNQSQMRQAESSVASATQQGEAAQQRIGLLRNAIAALLGQGPDRGLVIEAPSLLAVEAPALPSTLPSELLGHRPDVVAARWRVEAAARNIDAGKADFYPSLDLTAMAGLAAGRLSDLFTRDAGVALGGPALSLPIFDGPRLRGQLAGNNADYDLAVAHYDQTLVAAVREVADALQSARTLDKQIAAVAQARDAARKAWSLADSRYRAGLGTQLDVLAAQRPLLQLDQLSVALQAQRRTVAVDLAVAIGGGLSPTSPTLSSSGSP
ncbi:MAG: efflux transporter outer membrane subunit [Lysobacter sp.]|nr:efflux transporter outer membrane subunit [Lysobacter sp.]